MSRTIRRKNAHCRHWWFTDYVCIDGRWQTVKLEGKELAKKLHKYHGDGLDGYSPNKWFRSEEHNKMKSLSKGELSRFWKDPEYEVQIERRLLHDYWD